MNTVTDIAQTLHAHDLIGTKAETLQNLKGMLKAANVPDLAHFTVEDWRTDARSCIRKIRASLSASLVAVRSSSLDEDCWTASNAGTFTSLLGIDAFDDSALAAAVDEVIASYGSENGKNQVLVQEMVTGVSMSGVLFTRTIDHDAPYYVINYDDLSGQTDTVTAGTGKNVRTVFAYKGFPDGIAKVDQNLAPVLKAAHEIERTIQHDRLDIEFAVNSNGVHILQVRPLVGRSDTRVFSDTCFDDHLNRAYEQVFCQQKRQPYLHGETTILGVMPDANPAELIGIKPRPLALSLYRHLITEDMFSSVRTDYGYRDVRPYPLMISVLGHPFVDTRVSFNSMTPAEIDGPLTEALLNACMRKLRDTPNLHDKVEFEIVLNCWFSDIDKVIDDRFDFLSADDKRRLVTALRDVTRDAILRINRDMDDTAPLKARFDDTMNSGLDPLRKAFILLEDAQRIGAGPFVRLARSGFVAVTILRSLVRDGAVSQDEFDSFMASLHTVSKQIETDAHAVKTGKLSLDAFVATYGHLRPGTYDIMSSAYFEDTERFLMPVIETAKLPEHVEFAWSEEAAANIRAVFARAGLDISLEEFETFCRKAIEGREYGKFVYTKNMSHAIDHIGKWAQEHGLSRDDVSYLKWSMLKDIVLGVVPLDLQAIREQIRAARSEYALHQAVELPSVIASPEDVFAFERQTAEANFITSESVTASLYVLDVHDFDHADLAEKIVLIPGADPGYDWLFSQRIAGLVTMFGGANSHMAIRSAEQRLPAAIGVGQQTYNKLHAAKTITLNCESRSIKVIN